MTRHDFEQLLKQHGFLRERASGGRIRWRRSGTGRGQFCALENVRQGDWRLRLAVGQPPQGWPLAADSPSATGWVEAESPWFAYFTDLDPSDPEDAQFDSKERALQRCAEWLLDVGIKWLERPDSKSASEWRAEHNVLVRFDGRTIVG